MKKLLLLALILSIFPTTTFSHPGRTAGDGCHYCRTNCSSWGVGWNVRHCHGGSSAPTSSYSPPKVSIPSCPKLGHFSHLLDECVCNEGYRMDAMKKDCLKNMVAPWNKHLTNKRFDCREGYKKVYNRCKKIPKKRKKVVQDIVVDEPVEEILKKKVIKETSEEKVRKIVQEIPEEKDTPLEKEEEEVGEDFFDDLIDEQDLSEGAKEVLKEEMKKEEEEKKIQEEKNGFFEEVWKWMTKIFG